MTMPKQIDVKETKPPNKHGHGKLEYILLQNQNRRK